MLTSFPPPQEPPCDSKDNNESTMKGSQQDGGQPEQVSHRQQSSFEAHIQRIRALTSTTKKANRTNIQSSSKPIVGGTVPKKQIALKIIQKTASTWLENTSAQRTSEYVNDVTNSTYTPDDGGDRSTTEPYSDSERGAQTETDRTSSCDSQDEGAKKLKEVNEALQEKEEENTALRAELEGYDALKHAYQVQKSHRLDDKEKHDAAVEAYLEATAQNDDLESQMAQAEDAHGTCIAALEDIHREEMASLQVEVDEAKALVQQTTQKAIDDKGKANREKRKLLNATKKLRDTWAAEKQSLESKHLQMAADGWDAISANEKTIISLKARNQQLEKEHQVMSQMLRQKFPQEKALQQVIDWNEVGIQEVKDLQASKKQQAEQIENLLDKIQQMEGHYTQHQQAEQDARSEANRLQRKVSLLEDKSAQQKEHIRDAAKQIEVIQQGSVPEGAHCAALNVIECENEKLRNLLQAERHEKTELQNRFDKLDDENMRLSFVQETTDADLIEHKSKAETVQASTAAAMQELQYLRELSQQNGGFALTAQDKKTLTAHFAKLSDQSRKVIEKNADLTKELEKLRTWAANIEDKCDTKVRKAVDQAQYWKLMYYDEAVGVTERLHAEIADLKAEKGEKHFVESAPPPNPEVADRNALRTACMYGLDGVAPSHIPSAAYDPNFQNKYMAATYEALIALRPQGAHPLFMAGKVWLKREFEPLSEEEAAKRIEVGKQDRRAHNASLSSAGSAHPFVSSKHAPKNALAGIAPAGIASRTQLEGNVRSKSRIPVPSMLSTRPKDAYKALPTNNQVAAKRIAPLIGLWPSQIPKPQHL